MIEIKAESLTSDSQGQRPWFIVFLISLRPERAKSNTMPQSLNKVYIHIIFSTKNRENILPEKHLDEIHSYIGGIINKNLCQSLTIGGTCNHIHILCEMASTVSTSMLLMEIKRSSSKWIKREYPQQVYFAWQNGYAAFSVSQSKVDTVINYIKNQKEHHARKSFKEELIEFLNAYQVEYDEKYLWG